MTNHRRPLAILVHHRMLKAGATAKAAHSQARYPRLEAEVKAGLRQAATPVVTHWQLDHLHPRSEIRQVLQREEVRIKNNGKIYRLL